MPCAPGEGVGPCTRVSRFPGMGRVVRRPAAAVAGVPEAVVNPTPAGMVKLEKACERMVSVPTCVPDHPKHRTRTGLAVGHTVLRRPNHPSCVRACIGTRT